MITGNAVNEEENENKITINSDDEDEIIKEIKEKTKLDEEKIKKSITFKRKGPEKEEGMEEIISLEQPSIGSGYQKINGSIILTLG